MLSVEDNELVTRVTGDAPLAKFMKMFWVPALRSGRLEAGGEPVKVRLFGENYVAFRGHSGVVGFFNEACPHRLASLTTARNEDDSLVCLYHGWKFHASGKCVEVPTEPADKMESFCKKVPLKSYKTQEAGGLVWVWLGEGEPGPFPKFEFNTLPEDHVHVRIAEIDANWLQVFEGTVDSAHVSVLHQTWSKKVNFSVTKTLKDQAPRYEVDNMPYGLKACAVRTMPEGEQYVRITEYVHPWYSFIPHAPDETHVVAITVPMDDTSCKQFFVFYHLQRPLTYEDAAVLCAQFGVDPNLPPDNFYAGPKERWKQDRSLMAKGHFTGMYGVLIEDYVVVESMGPIVDRSKEFLGSSDMLISRVRRHLIKAARAVQNGEKPAGVDFDEYETIRSTNGIIPKGEDWRNTPK